MSTAASPRRRAPAKRLTNLVDDGESLVGREAELAAISEQFERGARLVSIVAPGGMGKTRLARRFALGRADFFSTHGGGGSWFCDLTEAQSVAGVCAVVASTLGVPLAKSARETTIVEMLGRALARRGRAFFVLDNCEHISKLVTAALRVWLEAAPDARFLITSRVVLGISHEHRWSLDPLTATASADLFLRRAQRVRPGLVPTDRDHEVIAEIVARLDGMPLAIELAAARLSVLSPAQIRDRLAAPLDLLVRRADAGRHASMRRTIEDSLRMLPEPEQQLFVSLAVFRDGFSLEAAESVLEALPDSPAVLPGLETLSATSLLRATPGDVLGGGVRFSFYEPIRELAVERFSKQASRETICSRHTAYFADEARRVRTRAEREPTHLPTLGIDLENFVVAHAHAVATAREGVEAGGATQALAIALALAPLLVTRGLMQLLFRLLDDAISVSHRVPLTAETLPSLAEALVVRGHARRELGELEPGRTDLEEGLALARRADLHLVEALAEVRIAEIVEVGGATRDAASHALRGLERLRAASPGPITTLREAELRVQLGHIHRREANLDGAEAETARAVALYRAAEHEEGLAMALYEAAVIALFRRRYDDALARFDEGLAIARRIGGVQAEGALLSGRGALLSERGDLDDAIDHHARSLLLFRSVGNRHREAGALYYLARAYLARGDASEAERLLARSRHIFRSVGVPRYEVLVEGCRAAALANRGDLAAAADCLAAATEIAVACGTEPALAATLAIHEAHVSLARAAVTKRDELLRHARALAERHPNDDPRAALRAMEKLAAQLARTAAKPDDEERGTTRALLVTEDGARFRLPSTGRVIDLSRRASLRRMLRALATRRIESPGEALPLDDLLAEAWPGEKISYEAATNRVHVALATLRKLGLREILLSVEGGYVLSPGIEVIVVAPREIVDTAAKS